MIVEKNPDLQAGFGKNRAAGLRRQARDAYALWGEAGARQDPLAGQDALTRTMWERLTGSCRKVQ